MTDILSRIAAHGEERRAERTRVEVPEWDCALWFPKALTVARQQRIRKGVSADDQAGLVVSYILLEAQTEDGGPAFPEGAKSRATLEGKADMAVLMRIIREAGGPGAAETVADAKNG